MKSPVTRSRLPGSNRGSTVVFWVTVQEYHIAEFYLYCKFTANSAKRLLIPFWSHAKQAPFGLKTGRAQGRCERWSVKRNHDIDRRASVDE